VKLEGKVAIVSGGGGGGNGEAIVQCLAEEGADVVVVDIDADAGRKSADKVKVLGRKSVAIEADVTDSKQVARLVQEAIDTFGKIDILVNVVGGGGKGKRARTKTSLRFVDQTEEEWDATFAINLKTQVLMCLAVVPHFIKQRNGKIVNISSGNSILCDPTKMIYSVIKAGVNHFTRLLAMELAEYSINVNSVVPGRIRTPVVERGVARMLQTMPDDKRINIEEYFEKFRMPGIPLKRELRPEDIGRAVLFLVTEDSKNITGECLPVNGGSLYYYVPPSKIRD